MNKFINKLQDIFNPPLVIIFRRDTRKNLESINPVLELNELAHETDTGLFKIGDGKTSWNDLEYTSRIQNIEKLKIYKRGRNIITVE